MYTPYHIHTDLSLLDSVTKYDMYIKKAQELGLKTIGFSEHGNIFSWIYKKKTVEKAGLKYLHCQEFYLTYSLEEKVRDNYHVILIARNFEGVKELNKLSSIAYQKDGHFYYDARITLDELRKTSDNIIITTACLASPLWKGRESKIFEEYLDFLTNNKHRVFLEIQYHNDNDQKEYNQKLHWISKLLQIPLIAGTDTHALDMKYQKGRSILLQAKNIAYGFEEGLDLTMKSYPELVDAFAKQGALDREVYLQAIENTNLMASMVEEFTLDSNPKYPKLYEDSEKVFKEKINKGVQDRGIAYFPDEKRKGYYSVIQEEFEVYKKLGAIDYMLLQEDIISWCKSKGIYVGYGRGSVNGSEIAYSLGITEMDSIKHKLNFFRFLNPNRISLADIDIDYPPSRRAEVIDYVASKPSLYFSEIVTYNTIAKKGSIREVGRALNYDLALVDEISKNIENDETKYRKQYPELFKYVDLLEGTIVSVGSHPSGYLVSPIPLDDNVGLFYTTESRYPVSQCNMKEVENLNYVKLDMLGLANIEIINETCRLVGIERLTPDNVDVNDEKVWESILESSLGVFQWEGDYAHQFYKSLFNKDVIEKIKELNPDFQYMDLFSMANGAIRPSGESYRDSLAKGIFNKNGHPALDDFLKETLGYLIYQEQIMRFLVQFCEFSEAESDSVRRGLAKKEGTEQFLKPIAEGFIKFMVSRHGETVEHAEEILQAFLKVIESASNYGFSINHSSPYSHIGYINAYLRYYYPLEFITVMLNLNEDDMEKTSKIITYAKAKGIEILPIKFRKSQSQYSPDKVNNKIYKGLKSIKFLNSNIADELFILGQKDYVDFIELLVDIEENTSVNSRQMDILIKLKFFSEFGNNEKLLLAYEKFKQRYKKTHKNDTKVKRLEEIREFVSTLIDNELTAKEQLIAEKEYLGYINTKLIIDDDYLLITDVDLKFTPKLTTYNLANGKEEVYKISKKQFKEIPLIKWDIIKIGYISQRLRKRLVDGVWIEIDDVFDKYLDKYYIISN